MRRKRLGFTLIELLVAMGILLILGALTIGTFSSVRDADKMRSASRGLQSAIAGARDRALHAKELRGFRLIVDPNSTQMATGLDYVQPIEGQPFSGAFIDPVDKRTVTLAGQELTGLRNAGFLSEHFQVRVDATGGGWHWAHSLTTIGPDETFQFGGQSLLAGQTVGITVKPINELLPQNAPISLPSGVVIDLALSQPADAMTRDIMFSPRGNVAGDLGARGLIHFVLRDVRDVVEGIIPGAANEHRETSILTLFPQTGHAATFPADTISGDLFRFAKTGERKGG
jgi:prepilin-type N-terminal cleavage/methylation domain-containing protein